MCCGKSVQAADSPTKDFSISEAYKNRVAGFPPRVTITKWQCSLREMVSHSYRSLKRTRCWPVAQSTCFPSFLSAILRSLVVP